MSRKDNPGKIAVRPHQKQLKTSALDTIQGYGTTYYDSEASRSTEDEALKKLSPAPELDDLQKEILLLERMGRDPDFRPDYPTRGRYRIAIYGSALWAWIGRQPGITLSAKEVEVQLYMISRIIERRAEMGLDSDIVK